jgi:anti-anti-sigma factor
VTVARSARARQAAPARPPRLVLAGELDIQVAAERKVVLMAFVDGIDAPLAGAAAMDLELDLRAVTELDTAGLQLLLLARRAAAERGLRLVLVEPSPAVLSALGLVGLGPDLAGEPVAAAAGSRA